MSTAYGTIIGHIFFSLSKYRRFYTKAKNEKFYITQTRNYATTKHMDLWVSDCEQIVEKKVTLKERKKWSDTTLHLYF